MVDHENVFEPVGIWVGVPAIRDGIEHRFELLENGVLRYDNVTLAALEQTHCQVLAKLMLEADTMLTTSQLMPGSEQPLRETSRAIREILRDLIEYPDLQPHIRVQNTKGEAESYFGYMKKPLDNLPEGAPNNTRRAVGKVATAETPPIIRRHAQRVPVSKQAHKPVIVESETAKPPVAVAKQVFMNEEETVAPAGARELITLARRYRDNLHTVIDSATLSRLDAEDLVITGIMQQGTPRVPHSVESTWLNLQLQLGSLQDYNREKLQAAWLRYAGKAVKLPTLKARLEFQLCQTDPQSTESKELIMRWIPSTLAKNESYR